MTYVSKDRRLLNHASRWWGLAGLALLLLLPARPADARDRATLQTNRCVECHRRVETVRAFPAWARDQITHWYGAVHGRVGVTCEKCHGGDPRAANKDVAHVGVVSPRRPQSPLYYKNVQEACGRCHAQVYQQFMQSDHYDVLKADHVAPSCTTCHGFEMDMGAVTPTQLVERCALCHNESRGQSPEVQTQARDAMQGSARVARAIERANWAVEFARDRNLDVMVPAALVDNARTRLRRTGELWHRFKLDMFTEELAAIQRVADRAYLSATQTFAEPTGKPDPATGDAPAP